jgi:hypothetical protein
MKRSIVFLFLAGYSWISIAQSLYPFKRNELWGYLDSTGKEVIAPAYPMAGFFYDGLAYVQIGDALGYIDVTGKEVIKSKYPAAYNFNEGYACVMEEEDWGVINKAGEMVIEPKFATPMMFHNGLARFKLDRSLFSTYGFVNTKGDTIIDPIFEKAGEFSNGLCMASKDGYTYGYINEKGEWAIQPTFDIGAALKINGEYDFSDKDFSNGYVAVLKEEKYGLMDKTGKMVLPFKYVFLGKYAEGVLPAKKDSLYGYIDLKGNWVIKPKYNGAEAFNHGLAAVSKGPFLEEKWGFINHEGKVVIPLTIYSNFAYTKPMEFWNGVVACYVEKDVFGYINRQGKVIWKMD